MADIDFAAMLKSRFLDEKVRHKPDAVEALTIAECVQHMSFADPHEALVVLKLLCEITISEDVISEPVTVETMIRTMMGLAEKAGTVAKLAKKAKPEKSP